MTEKRFELAYEKGNWWAVRDGEITLWKEEVVGLLNEQDEMIKKQNQEILSCHDTLVTIEALCDAVLNHDFYGNL